ncbi:MAG: glucuronate isomerase [Flavobacteriaceae bacterium]
MEKQNPIPPFIHDDFLLESTSAKALYHDYVKDLPIIDYHCHLSPKDIAENTIFDSITALWIDGDHYKWRAMRTLGVEEKYLTGTASPKEKFVQFASALPLMMRNPLYHWTQLELKRYFSISELLSKASANAIFKQTNAMATSTEFSTQRLLQKMQVEYIGTTDDPIDSLEYHSIHSASGHPVRMAPSFRPDRCLLIQSDGFNDYLDTLERVCGLEIQSFEQLCFALEQRMDFFHQKGCRISDHGLEYLPFTILSPKEIEFIFTKRRRKNEEISKTDSEGFQTALLLFLSKKYHKLGWVQQFHLGAMRNNNSRMFKNLGADTGWDSIGQYPTARSLSKFLDALDSTDQLTKTVLYNLNPADNEIMATMIGNFNDGSIKGKVQWGSGWWFSDQLEGMTKQINTLSNMGVLSCFIGMLTDSRSFLSFPRHEYFRRLLCNLFGNDIEKGLLPKDLPWIGKIISDISYGNAKNYFELPE